VSFNRWTYFEEVNTTCPTIEVLNVGALGIWSVISAFEPYEIALATLASVTLNIEEQVVLNIYYQGMNYQFTKTQGQADLIFGSVVDEEKRQWMWNDSYMGL
jgi:hypothetical protein